MKRIRAAVVGVGYLGRFHAQKYASLDGVDLVGVFDADAERAAAVAEEVGTRAVSSIDEFYGAIDTASVVTPTNTHFKIARGLLGAGVDVLLEKPMTETSEEAEELIRTAEEAGAILQIGHLERFNAAVVALEGRVSCPMFIEAQRLSNFPDRGTDVDVVLDLMIHDIDIILNLVKADVEGVDAAGVPIVSDKVDIANARLTFSNGCVANVTASRVSMEPARRIKLFEPDSYIAIDYAKQHISIFGRGTDPESGRPAVVGEEIDIERSDTLLSEIESFVESSVSRRPPLVSGADGLRALEVAQKIQDSLSESMERVQCHPPSFK